MSWVIFSAIIFYIFVKMCFLWFRISLHLTYSGTVSVLIQAADAAVAMAAEDQVLSKQAPSDYFPLISLMFNGPLMTASKRVTYSKK